MPTQSEAVPQGRDRDPRVLDATHHLCRARRAEELDLFDRAQLATVLEVCAEEPSLSAAGRRLFAKSLEKRGSKNDADRLRKYLARFGLDLATVHARTRR
jgi:transcriptional regulatory protein RtcR